ncbi:GHKL domain-containing protein [Flavobacterium panici]|uniref:histidine kinase n=1 Tax=Flavobacterium panici TaxID=2654843 RepID=A0A9N8J397_9FLAO|nr:GHKL domain-containing protein [Flavobacterium panici]
MVNINFYLNIVLRIVFITISSLGFAFCFDREFYIFSFLFLFILILQVLLFIRYINYTNRKLSHFLNGIENEDFTLHFPEKDLIKPFKNLNQSLNKVNSLIHELHLKKQAQEQFYHEILKQANIGIFAFNENGHIIYSNPTVENLLNYRPLNHIKQLRQVDEKLFSFFDNLKPFEQKLFQITNEREKKQLSIKSSTINMHKENLFLVTIQDINKELEEKETDSWIKLIKVLTHEIMNSIAPITSISESILKYYKVNNKLIPISEFDEKHIINTAKGLEIISEQGDNLMSFVRSYRTLLSVPVPEKEMVPAKTLLDNIFLLINPNNDTVKIDIEIVPENLELYIDKKQITQVLINLGKNALQSLNDQENGIIKISAGINNQDKKFIMLSDNGPGITAELMEEIFVPFFTTKTTGTGIGLSLSKQIMRLHDGTIKVHSIPNIETRFVLNF